MSTPDEAVIDRIIDEMPYQRNPDRTAARAIYEIVAAAVRQQVADEITEWARDGRFTPYGEQEGEALDLAARIKRGTGSAVPDQPADETCEHGETTGHFIRPTVDERYGGWCSGPVGQQGVVPAGADPRAVSRGDYGDPTKVRIAPNHGTADV